MITNIIIKVTLDCNINCKYCYVHRNRTYISKKTIMDRNTLYNIIIKISDYLNKNEQIDNLVLYWHGGEPLLAGKIFFETCSKLEKEFLPKRVQITNTIQTNGLILDQEWIESLEKIHFDICLSLDGPEYINDRWRTRKDGNGTYHEVVDKVNLLRKNKIPLSVLSVITPAALESGKEIYQHLRQLGFTRLDFMYPFYSRIDNTLDEEISPSKWGDFFIDVFDAWMDEDNPQIYIRSLHDFCMATLGAKTSMCSSSSDCSYVITIDPSGNIYTCDDLLSYADSLLGNIHENTLFEIARHPKLVRLSKKSVLYGSECINCSYFPICKGGCTLFRATHFNNFHGVHYYCDAQRKIIDHIKKHFSGYQSNFPARINSDSIIKD